MREPRISGEQVVAAYKATGLHPIRTEFACKRDGGLCGCPLTAVWASGQAEGWQKKRPKTIEKAVDAWVGKVYGEDYARPFVGAFDRPGRPNTYGTYRGIQGHIDGNAVAHAVWAAFAEVLGA